MRRRSLVVALVLAVGAGALVFSRPRERPANSTVSAAGVVAEPIADGAPPTAGIADPAPTADRAPAPPGALAPPGAAAAPAAFTRPRSPLERSPGYYPPDDPESMSVVTGRREAPVVDLEFRGGAAGVRDLALRLLSALSARDENALHALRITREEFEVVIWPELPESRPITNITADDAWQASLLRSISSADRAVGSYGGRPLELLRVEASAVAPYRNFTLHRGITITARDNASGEVFAMKFASSFVERHGRFKVVLYRD